MSLHHPIDLVEMTGNGRLEERKEGFRFVTADEYKRLFHVFRKFFFLRHFKKRDICPFIFHKSQDKNRRYFYFMVCGPCQPEENLQCVVAKNPFYLAGDQILPYPSVVEPCKRGNRLLPY